MQSKLSIFVALLACTQSALAAATNFSLYAYGKELPVGMKMYYGDGMSTIATILAC